MNIPLEKNTSAPLYAQIAAFLRGQIERGVLEPETRLPSIRRLASSLGVNRVTVETAYAELEADGLVVSRCGSGTYVLPPFPGCTTHRAALVPPSTFSDDNRQDRETQTGAHAATWPRVTTPPPTAPSRHQGAPAEALTATRWTAPPSDTATRSTVECATRETEGRTGGRTEGRAGGRVYASPDAQARERHGGPYPAEGNPHGTPLTETASRDETRRTVRGTSQAYDGPTVTTGAERRTYARGGMLSPAGHPAWQEALLHSRADLMGEAAVPLQIPAPEDGVIALASGNSDARLFPLDAFRRTMRSVLCRDGIHALEYEAPAGYPPLRRTIARILADQGMPATPDNVLVTSGSQQALHLVAQVVLRPGDPVYVESPSYADGMDLFRALGFRLVPVDMDDEGMRADALETALSRHGFGLVFTMPSFQNPTGICMSGQRRRRIAAIAEAHGVPILEDDYVGDIRYEGHAQPSLYSLTSPGQTFYAGTFSKMLIPGLRVGYLVADGPVLHLLVRAKRMHDLSTSGLVQRTLERFVDLGRYRSHLTRTCRTYRVRRDALLEAMHTHLPREVTVPPVRGGLFAWPTLPADIDASALLREAARRGVTAAPGTAFFIDAKRGERHLRINFTQHDPDVLEEAMSRLGKAVHACRGTARGTC